MVQSQNHLKSFQELGFYRQTTNSALPKTQGLFSRDYVRFREGKHVSFFRTPGNFSSCRNWEVRPAHVTETGILSHLEYVLCCGYPDVKWQKSENERLEVTTFCGLRPKTNLYRLDTVPGWWLNQPI